ncbi:MAG: CBS domain-containing protein [Candidatus Eiseniibacteriota bacterium]
MQSELNLDYNSLVIEVLKLAKDGITKKIIMDKFSLSRPQVRKLMAELVSKDLLRYHLTLKFFMTTAKGNIYIKKQSKNSTSMIPKATDLSKEVIMLNSGKSLWNARNQMLRYKISRIVISDNGKATGIVTEKDIAKFLYNVPPTRTLSEIALKELVNKKLITVDEDASMDYCAKLILDKHISSLVIIDNRDKPKGIITKTDIVEFCAYHQPINLPVYKYMSTKVHTVAPDETIHTISMLMDTYKISRVVVEKNRKPVGIVTTRDFLPISLIYGTGSVGRYWTTRSDMISGKARKKFMPSGILGTVVAEDIMTFEPLTVYTNTDIAEAAKVMIRNNISGLPVINTKGDLIGIITKTDIVNARLRL